MSLRTKLAPRLDRTSSGCSLYQVSKRSRSANSWPSVLRISQNAPPHISVPVIKAELKSGWISLNCRFFVRSQDDAVVAGRGLFTKLHGKYQAKPDSIA